MEGNWYCEVGHYFGFFIDDHSVCEICGTDYFMNYKNYFYWLEDEISTLQFYMFDCCGDEDFKKCHARQNWWYEKYYTKKEKINV